MEGSGVCGGEGIAFMSGSAAGHMKAKIRLALMTMTMTAEVYVRPEMHIPPAMQVLTGMALGSVAQKCIEHAGLSMLYMSSALCSSKLLATPQV